MRESYPELVPPLAGGLCTLVIAMGIGRFAYTALLPAMQAETGLSNQAAGLLASLNYVGYLAGALGAGFAGVLGQRARAFRATLVASLATTALMAATVSVPLWGLLRLASGVVSGALFVWSTDRVMAALAGRGRSRLAGVHFAGVGMGIALSGAATPLFEMLAGWRGGWIGVALLGVAVAWPSWFWLGRAPAGRAAEPETATAAARAPAGPPPFSVTLLMLVYFLEGFGYIVSGTFMVTILEAGGGSGELAWVVVGLAAAPSCLFWAHAAQRWGFVPMITLSMLLQALGIALPLLSASTAAAVGGAVLFGGTFMGVTTLVIAFGRQVFRSAPARVIGLLTASFGLGQILGPLAAGWLAGQAASFAPSLIMAAAAVLLGALLTGAGGLSRRMARQRMA